MKRVFALVDERIDRECELSLMRLGFRVIKLPKNPLLEDAVASHTDLCVHLLGRTLIASAEYCEDNEELFTLLSSEIRGLSFGFSSDVIRSPHPSDAALNALVLGSGIYAREDAISPFLLEKAKEMGLELIPVRQGYPACTALKLNDGAVITADPGMEKILSKNGIRVYKIDSGGIDLPPYPYGFIGGAAGVYGGCVFFLGDPATHPSYDVISEAVRREGLRPVALSDGRLSDLGGIVFIEDNSYESEDDRH